MARFALTRRKECRTLTPRGWIVLVAAVALAGWLAVRSASTFLAVTEPVEGTVLVVEGWVTDDGLRAVVERFAEGHERIIVTTGGPVPLGSYLVPFRTYAALGRRSLIVLGVDSARIVAVPARDALRDRTYNAARALRTWLDERSVEIGGVNVCSQGAHARRTRLLYERALGSRYRVGIIAVPDIRYDGARWWRTSDGFRIVVDELVAYAYARLGFGG
jgi:hypothetical protein